MWSIPLPFIPLIEISPFLCCRATGRPKEFFWGNGFARVTNDEKKAVDAFSGVDRVPVRFQAEVRRSAEAPLRTAKRK